MTRRRSRANLVFDRYRNVPYPGAIRAIEQGTERRLVREIDLAEACAAGTRRVTDANRTHRDPVARERPVWF
jgi:hypothetical protein